MCTSCTHSPSSTPAPTTSSTTLPTPVTIPVGTPAGPLQQFGPLYRIAVEPVAKGQIAFTQAEDRSIAPIEIGYRRFGSGPAIILVLGQHATMTWWDPQLLSDLGAHHDVTIFDLPGVGYSSAGDSASSIASMADITAGLSYALGLKAPALLGWGLGGTIALEAQVRHPHAFSSLVLASPIAPNAKGSAIARDAARAFASADATTTGLSMYMFPPNAAAARIGWLGRIGELPPDDIVAGAISAEARLVASLRPTQWSAATLARVSVPVLIVVGADDEVVPETDGATLSHKIPTAQLVTLAGAGYGALFQDEKAFVSALLQIAP